MGKKEIKKQKAGSLGGAAVWRLPLAQGTILETGIESHIRLPVHGACFSLCLRLCLSLSLCVTVINKQKIKKELTKETKGIQGRGAP